MHLTLSDLAELSLLTLAYWLLDLAIRRDAWASLFAGPPRDWISRIAWCFPLCALAWFWHWSDVPEFFSLRLLSLIIAGGLCWKATTKDIDPVFAKPHWGSRITLPLLVAGIWFSPAFVLAAVYLLTHPFRLWEHHSTFPMRVLLAVGSYLVCAGLAPFAMESLFVDSATLFFFVVTIQVSHYLITALAKGWLGPRPYSWVTDNRLHHLAATSYSWGWAKFLPWSVWRRVIAVVRPIEKPMQLAAFSIELFAPLAILHPYVALGFSIAWAGFHLGVFALSGLLFWDWTLANLAIAASIFFLPASVAGHAFGWHSLIACFIFLALFPLRHKLWKPMPLGWWDTPFTQRMHWIAIGESGKRYGVYNNFMCPNERLYGKLHGCFLAPMKGITYHLGEVWKYDLRDAIRSAGPSLERLDKRPRTLRCGAARSKTCGQSHRLPEAFLLGDQCRRAQVGFCRVDCVGSKPPATKCFTGAIWKLFARRRRLSKSNSSTAKSTSTVNRLCGSPTNVSRRSTSTSLVARSTASLSRRPKRSTICCFPLESARSLTCRVLPTASSKGTTESALPTDQPGGEVKTRSRVYGAVD